jgi:hypothetical protein
MVTARETIMGMSRGGSWQQMPDDFAALLRELHTADDPIFNTALAAAHGKGWRPPALATALQMNTPAVRKRIERARARDGERSEQLAAAAGLVIPAPIPVRTMAGGRQLSPVRIAELQGMQRVASKVNGAMPVGHPDRRVSEEFTGELRRLIDDEGYNQAYLAAVLDISHRAISSRLERHGMRNPCPSVAGTASGIYYARKIGDPGQGAPRVTREQRAELRLLWQAYLADPRDARQPLARKLREYLDRGFTPANLAQTMSTKQRRVRYRELQEVLAGAQQRAGADT